MSAGERSANGALGLVDVEVPGYSTHVQKPEHEQHQGNQAHDGQRCHQEQSESVHGGSPLPMAAPPRLFEHRKWLRSHPNTNLTEAVGTASGRATSALDLAGLRLGWALVQMLADDESARG